MKLHWPAGAAASRLAICLGLLLVPVLLAEQESRRPARDDSAAVVGSVHDLTPPTGQARLGRGVCAFCHAAHLPDTSERRGMIGPLWNRTLPVNTYEVDASTAPESSAQTEQLGSSKLCLSCHDGSIAVGQTLKDIPDGDPGLARKLSPLTLAGSHSLGIRPVDDGQLVATLFDDLPKTGSPSVALRDGRIECLSCHTAHNPGVDSVVKKFLVESNKGGAICLACHDPERPQPNQMNGWQLSAHAQAHNEVPDIGPFGSYGNVADNACGNCHQPHEAGAGVLLRDEGEKVCSLCHDGSNLSPIIPDVMTDFDKPYSHPTTTQTDLHDPAENVFPLTENRHAECVDCHQPHSVGNVSEDVSPPRRPSALSGASGFDGYRALYPATNEYEVCFKCHADSPNKPQNEFDYRVYGHTSRRQAETSTSDPKNLREKFASSVSRHNITQPRRLNDVEVPSLRASIVYPDNSSGRELAVGTYIYCSDCHLSNDAARLGGKGANGPHGSVYPHILGARYQQENPPVLPGEESGGAAQYVPGADGSYALCNMCHDIENSILADQSFPEHGRHVVKERTSCATCHDPHGIQEAVGTSDNNASLISFDLTIVAPDSLGRLYFDGLSRECYLSCHGVEHSPAQY